MEKRFYLGVGILAFFLILGLVISMIVLNTGTPLSQQLAQASQEALSGDLETGISLAVQAKTQWEASWHSTAMVADHAPMDEIDSLFAQMEVYAQAGDRLHFGSYCARLSELVQAIVDAQRLNLWNLL